MISVFYVIEAPPKAGQSFLLLLKKNKEFQMETKEPVSAKVFEEGIKESSPMPLFSNQKKEKTSYDYFQSFGETLTESLKNGTSPLLPGSDGFVDLKPAYNINTNSKSEGLAQLMLLEKQKELDAPTAGFVTFETVKKAQEAGVDCKIAKGSKGVVIPTVDEKNWGEIKFKSTWFNISQIENADKLVEFCKEKMTEKYNNDVAYIKEHYPNSTYKEKKNPAELDMNRPNEKAMPLNEKTEEPFQYIAQVFNAVQTGRKLYVTPEQAASFKEKTVQLLTAEYQPGKIDVCAIKKLANSAEYLYLNNKKYLKEYIQKKETEQTKQPVKKAKKIERDYKYSRER